ncbi:MAG: hypothetical protein JST19_03250 [Bacteroidetes bacterium]|nr:hypothetical protein [Bacteroidota bacterium]
MGLFLTLSGVIGKSPNEVENALRNYLETSDGGLEQASVNSNHRNFCVIQHAEENTTIVYPPYFLKWDECANYLSRKLKAPVFILHIYDGDFWSYTLFVNGEIKDQFMPIPDYFDENITEEEIDSWKGNAQVIVNYVPSIVKADIEKYLVRWNLNEEEGKAYENDESTNCEYQLFDFMRKLKLPYKIDENGVPIGKVFRFWSKDIQLEPNHVEQPRAYISSPMKKKSWRKFW